MMNYVKSYEAATGKAAPAEADKLAPLFQAIATGQLLPPRGQQAVDAGLTAHSLNDPRENRPVYQYYQWILKNCLVDQPPREIGAQLIGMAFTSANIFKTDLPQPLTLNPWQVPAMLDYPTKTQQAILIENNGVFIWLHYRHPDWPLINQAGNDFNDKYLLLLQQLVRHGLRLAYLGDLDSEGIRIIDRLYQAVPELVLADLLAIQTPQNVANWLVRFGKQSSKRTKRLAVQTPVLQTELESIITFKKFVEQEQLIAMYEQLIPRWLDNN